MMTRMEMYVGMKFRHMSSEIIIYEIIEVDVENDRIKIQWKRQRDGIMTQTNEPMSSDMWRNYSAVSESVGHLFETTDN